MDEGPSREDFPAEAGAAAPFRLLGRQQKLGDVLQQIRQRGADGTDGASEAAPPSKAPAPRPGLEQLLVRFEAGDTSFAVPMSQMTEIGDRPPCTQVPRLPPFFPGVANIRGEVVLVLDLSLYMHPNRASAAKRSLLLHGQDQQLLGSILVDAVHGIAPFVQEEVRPPTSATHHPFRRYEMGVFEFQNRVYSVVDLVSLLKSPELRSHLGARS